MAVSPVLGGVFMAMVRKANAVASVFRRGVLLAIACPMGYTPILSAPAALLT
jgi:hypothetical protein